MMVWQRDAMVYAKRATEALEAIAKHVGRHEVNAEIERDRKLEPPTETGGLTITQVRQWILYRERVFHDPTRPYRLPDWADPSIDYTGTILAAHLKLLRKLLEP